jgi:hypothetical protein
MSSNSEYALNVRVIKATLPDAGADSSAAPDVFCAVVVAGTQRQVTRTIAAFAPEWNETFAFTVANPSTAALTFRLWTSNDNSQDATAVNERVGDASLSLVDVALKDGVWCAQSLEGKMNEANYTLSVELQSVGFSQPAGIDTEAKAAATTKSESVVDTPSTGPPSPTASPNAESTVASNPAKKEETSEAKVPHKESEGPAGGAKAAAKVSKTKTSETSAPDKSPKRKAQAAAVVAPRQSSSSAPAKVKRVHVKVVSASGLKATDVTTGDIACAVTLGACTCQTAVVAYGSEPFWNEELTFSEIDPTKDVIRLQLVATKGTLRNLDEAQLELASADLRDGHWTKFARPLNKTPSDSSDERCELLFEVRAENFGVTADPQRANPKPASKNEPKKTAPREGGATTKRTESHTAASSSPSPAPSKPAPSPQPAGTKPAPPTKDNAAERCASVKRQKKVRIVLRYARALPPPAAVGMKEPYCSLRLGNQHFKSSVAENAMFPEWNESVVFVIDSVAEDKVELRMWEDDFDTSKIGIAYFGFESLTRGDWKNVEVVLQGGTVGEIRVRVGLFAINFGARAQPTIDLGDEAHRSPTQADYAPPLSLEQDRRGFVENLHGRLDKLRAEAIETRGCIDQSNAYTDIVAAAMLLERNEVVDDAVAVLSHVVRITHVERVASLALNNLACIEKRRGNVQIAVHHLERAADHEGGMQNAEASTLLNLASAYTSLGHFVEAAAVAFHAVRRCEADADCRIVVKATGYHNLAVALEASAEYARASDYFAKAAACLPVGHTARPQLLNAAQRNADLAAPSTPVPDAKEASPPATKPRRRPAGGESSPSRVREAAKLLRLRNLPPLQTPGPEKDDRHLNAAVVRPDPSTHVATHRSPSPAALQAKEAPSQPREGHPELKLDDAKVGPSPGTRPPGVTLLQIPPAHKGKAREVGLGRRLPPLPDKSKHAALEDATIALYIGAQPPQRLTRLLKNSPVKRGTLPKAVTPTPMHTDRGTSPLRSASALGFSSSNAALTRRSAMSSVAGSGGGLSPKTKAAWNPDSTLHGTALAKPLKPRPTYEIEKQVEDRYIPRKVFVTMEDLRYKETTRRNTLTREWKRQCDSICSIMGKYRIAAEEESARAELYLDQARTSRVLRHWVRGRLVYCRGAIDTETLETQKRDDLSAEEANEAQSTLKLHAAQLQMLAAEEVSRHDIRTERQLGLDALYTHMESALAELRAADRFKDSNRGIAHALAAWSLEAVVPQAEVLDLLIPSDARKSLFVAERYVMFGLPGAPQPSSPMKGQKPSSSTATPNQSTLGGSKSSKQ